MQDTDASVKEDVMGSAKKRLELSGTEQGVILFNLAPSITTVTFYSGTPPIKYLQDRTREIVKANPWLSAKPSKAGGTPHMLYEDDKLPELFQNICGLEGLDSSNSYDKICQTAVQLMVKKGSDINDADKGSFLVSVVTNAATLAKNEFALVVSLSHVVGDGHTFYAIHNMLSLGASVYSLNPVRELDFPKLQEELMGANEAKGIVDVALILRALKGVLKLKCSCLSLESLKGLLKLKCSCQPRKLKAQAFIVSKSYVQERKSECVCQGDAKFVSTNDIVTSWFFSTIAAKYALMAVNLRNRIGCVTDKHAGNYENFIIYQMGDYESPTLIRKSVDACRRVNSSFPSFWVRLSRQPFAIISNWATFDQGVELPGTTQQLHLPLYPLDALHSDLNLCIVFRPMKGKLAMFFLSDHGLPVSAFGPDSPLDNALNFGQP